MEEATEAQIKEWKKAHGAVFKYSHKDAICYCKKPSLQAFGLSAKFGKDNFGKGLKLLLDDCWLEGDEVFKRESDYMLGLFDMIQKDNKKKEVKSQAL